METGLALLPGGLSMGLLGQVIRPDLRQGEPAAAHCYGLGSVFMVLTLRQFSTLNGSGPLWWVITLHVALSFGLARPFTPAFTTGLSLL